MLRWVSKDLDTTEQLNGTELRAKNRRYEVERMMVPTRHPNLTRISILSISITKLRRVYSIRGIGDFYHISLLLAR